jgi:hypothetical protein
VIFEKDGGNKADLERIWFRLQQNRVLIKVSTRFVMRRR